MKEEEENYEKEDEEDDAMKGRTIGRQENEECFEEGGRNKRTGGREQREDVEDEKTKETARIRWRNLCRMKRTRKNWAKTRTTWKTRTRR